MRRERSEDSGPTLSLSKEDIYEARSSTSSTTAGGCSDSRVRGTRRSCTAPVVRSPRPPRGTSRGENLSSGRFKRLAERWPWDSAGRTEPDGGSRSSIHRWPRIDEKWPSGRTPPYAWWYRLSKRPRVSHKLQVA